MLCRVVFVRTDVSEEPTASIIRVKRDTDLGKMLAVIAFLRSVLRLLDIANDVLSSLILFTLIMEAIYFSQTSVLTKAKRRNISEGGIHQSHRCENLKSYKEQQY
jgi:hypothetical protein